MNAVWKVTKLFRHPQLDGKSDVVRKVFYTVEMREERNGKTSAVSHVGEVILDVADLTGFIDFASLDEATVMHWVKTKLGAEKVVEIEAELALRMEFNFAPGTISGLPWIVAGE